MQFLRYAIFAALLTPTAALACDETQTLPEIAWFNVMEIYEVLVEIIVCDTPTAQAAEDRIADLAVQTGTEVRREPTPNS